mmetsp:Transcript_123324/g.348470  ORF Transcript_123324/g.348470 Transcript_123324/m.348470 type:complete len:201 (-) Transcript_123324:251-853(-)
MMRQRRPRRKRRFAGNRRCHAWWRRCCHLRRRRILPPVGAGTRLTKLCLELVNPRLERRNLVSVETVELVYGHLGNIVLLQRVGVVLHEEVRKRTKAIRRCHVQWAALHWVQEVAAWVAQPGFQQMSRHLLPVELACKAERHVQNAVNGGLGMTRLAEPDEFVDRPHHEQFRGVREAVRYHRRRTFWTILQQGSPGDQKL